MCWATITASPTALRVRGHAVGLAVIVFSGAVLPEQRLHLAKAPVPGHCQRCAYASMHIVIFFGAGSVSISRRPLSLAIANAVRPIQWRTLTWAPFANSSLATSGFLQSWIGVHPSCGTPSTWAPFANSTLATSGLLLIAAQWSGVLESASAALMSAPAPSRAPGPAPQAPPWQRSVVLSSTSSLSRSCPPLRPAGVTYVVESYIVVGINLG